MVEVDDPEDGTKPPGAELERIQEEIDQDPNGPAFTRACQSVSVSSVARKYAVTRRCDNWYRIKMIKKNK
jgi:hypothetical protein